jgi:hypothetical protein
MFFSIESTSCLSVAFTFLRSKQWRVLYRPLEMCVRSAKKSPWTDEYNNITQPSQERTSGIGSPTQVRRSFGPATSARNKYRQLFKKPAGIVKKEFTVGRAIGELHSRVCFV